MPPSPLSSRPITSSPDDMTLVKRVFDANQDEERSPERITWQYLDNPDGRVFIDIAEDATVGRVAGMYAVFPVRMKVGTQSVVGSQSLDTLTDADYRGRGLFISLANSVYDRLHRNNIAVVYGFPNGNSAHGFFKKLGWTKLDPVPFLIRPLRSRYFLKRLPKLGRLLGRLPDLPIPRMRKPRLRADLRIERVTSFDARFDDLWNSVAPALPVAVIRDSTYLTWRFGRRPTADYETMGLFARDSLVGFVTFCVREKHGGRIGYIMELLVTPEVCSSAAALLGRAMDKIRSLGADAVLAWQLDHSPYADAFRRNGFMPMPQRLRPIELHFGAKSLDGNLVDMVSHRENWYISYADSDTV